MFTTKDRDNDGDLYNCADKYKGAWWYKTCFNANLNILFDDNQHGSNPVDYMTWFTLRNGFGGLIFSEMKIKY